MYSTLVHSDEIDVMSEFCGKNPQRSPAYDIYTLNDE
jgi:hypothetical protein